jgi:acetyl-CoA acetyltransferase
VTGAAPAVVGLGATDMSTSPGALAHLLAAEAVERCLTDAGVGHDEVDGLLVASSQGVRPDRVGVGLARAVGLGDLRLLEHIEIKGASTLAMLEHAVLSINAGRAHSVLCVFADAPLRAGGRTGSTYARSGGTAGVRGLERAAGLLGSVPTYALLAARYLAVTGTDRAALGAVAVTARAWAQHNPRAVYRTPLDLDTYQASRVVAEPLRVLDCARPVNGAAAVLVSSRRPNDHRPLVVAGSAAEHPVRRRRAPAESWFGGGGRAAVDALAAAGRTPADIDVVELYDPFSVVTLCLLEEYGFAKAGDAGPMALAGELAPGGSLPVNTGGGQLSGFYLQGMTPLVEAVEQLRGTAGARQVDGAAAALVGGIGGRLDHHACVVLEAA